MQIIHYEVYVFENRGWVLHSRYPQGERKLAIEEAHSLERNLRMFVRVFSETYNSEESSVEELEVYSTPDAPVFSSNTRQGRPSAREYDESGNSDVYYPDLSPFSAKSVDGRKHIGAVEIAASTQVVARMISIAALSLFCGAVLVAVVPYAVEMLWHMGFQVKIPPAVYGRILFLVFVVTFLSVAIPLSIAFLPRLNFGLSRHNEDEDQEEEYNHERDVRKSLDVLAEIALKEALAKKRKEEKKKKEGEDEAPVGDFALDESWVADPDAPTPEELGLPPLPDALAGAVADQDGDEPILDEADNGTDSAAKERPEPVRRPPDVAALLPAMRRFIDGTVAVAQKVVGQMDSYNRFALHLYAMGAVESLCEYHRLDSNARSILTKMSLNTLGTQSPMVERFQEKLGEYLLEPRYLAVVQGGRNAMNDVLLGKEAEAHRILREVFTTWNGRNEKRGQTTTVMFTDIVGSTALTQSQGDTVAQTIIRRYNGIVRDMLSQHNGREIKYTGDGLMAGFSSAVDAANAAVQIQKKIAEYNAKTTDTALQMRVGLNAGEPIEEDGDLFGSTVQLASRVCAAAGAGQIFCTAVVKELNEGKALKFQSQGAVSLKGFELPQMLYQILWRS